MRWIAGIVLAAILILALGSFLPLIETDAWWIRWWDFPRVQIGFLLIVLLAIYLIASDSDAARIGMAVLVLVALGYHGWRLLPYTTVAPPMALAAETCPEGADLRVLSYNAQRSNESAGAFLELVERTDPDLLLVMETDAYWDEALAALGDDYPHVVQHIPQDARYFGMHLLSRLPLQSPQVVTRFGTETPSIVTGVRLRSGDRVRFHGLHPRPPVAFEQGTTMRDATIYRAALDAASSARPTIIAGDLNAVSWETVTRRALRLGGLLEPRIGRGLVPTYAAESLWRSWPLDYVLYQEAFGVMLFGRLPSVGSDHHPVIAHLCLLPGMAERQEVPRAEPEDIRDAEEALAAAERLRAGE